MIDRDFCERLKKELHNGSTVWARVGEREKFSYDIGADKVCVADLVIYLNYRRDIAIVWNNQYRRGLGSKTHTFNWEKKIDDEKCKSGFIMLEETKS